MHRLGPALGAQRGGVARPLPAAAWTAARAGLGPCLLQAALGPARSLCGRAAPHLVALHLLQHLCLHAHTFQVGLTHLQGMEATSSVS